MSFWSLDWLIAIMFCTCRFEYIHEDSTFIITKNIKTYSLELFLFSALMFVQNAKEDTHTHIHTHTHTHFLSLFLYAYAKFKTCTYALHYRFIYIYIYIFFFQFFCSLLCSCSFPSSNLFLIPISGIVCLIFNYKLCTEHSFDLKGF